MTGWRQLDLLKGPRQRGTKLHPGTNVGIGKDHTLFATATGHVKYSQQGPKAKSTVSIEPVKQ